MSQFQKDPFSAKKKTLFWALFIPFFTEMFELRNFLFSMSWKRVLIRPATHQNGLNHRFLSAKKNIKISGIVKDVFFGNLRIKLRRSCTSSSFAIEVQPLRDTEVIANIKMNFSYNNVKSSNEFTVSGLSSLLLNLVLNCWYYCNTVNLTFSVLNQLIFTISSVYYFQLYYNDVWK